MRITRIRRWIMARTWRHTSAVVSTRRNMRMANCAGSRWWACCRFFAITGWAGLALIDAALPDMLAVVLGVGLGVLAMYLCAVVMRWFGRLGEAGNVSLAGAVGQFAEAYLPIGPERAEGGKVSLTLQGRFLVLDARDRCDARDSDGCARGHNRTGGRLDGAGAACTRSVTARPGFTCAIRACRIGRDRPIVPAVRSAWHVLGDN